MKSSKKVPETVGEFIRKYPAAVRKKLSGLRKTIKEEAPQAEETIKYGMPTYVLNGNLIYFAAAKNHIAVYPVPVATPALKAQMEPYRAHKSTLRFPLDKPLPLSLIRKIVKARVKQNLG